jgi:hypothetical protein
MDLPMLPGIVMDNGVTLPAELSAVISLKDTARTQSLADLSDTCTTFFVGKIVTDHGRDFPGIDINRGVDKQSSEVNRIGLDDILWTVGNRLWTANLVLLPPGTQDVIPLEYPIELEARETVIPYSFFNSQTIFSPHQSACSSRLSLMRFTTVEVKHRLFRFRLASFLSLTNCLIPRNRIVFFHR